MGILHDYPQKTKINVILTRSFSIFLWKMISRIFCTYFLADFRAQWKWELRTNMIILPEKMIFFLSWLTALGSGTGSLCLITETDSPVKIDWSILKVVDKIWMILISAGILSPTISKKHQNVISICISMYISPIF